MTARTSDSASMCGSPVRGAGKIRYTRYVSDTQGVYWMAVSGVNGRRRAYHNAGRIEQAAANRRRVLAAAHRVLVERGYAATTINAIAAEAHVSREMIYKAFGNKLALVKRLYDIQLIGDDEERPLGDRPEWAAMMAERSAEGVLLRYATIVRELYERLGALLGVLLLAARSGEPDLASFGAETDRQRLGGPRRVIH